MKKPTFNNQAFVARLRLFLLIMTISFSFGGFTFYSAFVVKIGGEVIDETMQGFVTRQVTHVINIASAITLVILIWDALAGKSSRSRFVNRSVFVWLAIYAVCLAILVITHPRLDALLDPVNMSVSSSERFYQLHRIYMIASTIQWLATVFLIGFICFNNRDDR